MSRVEHSPEISLTAITISGPDAIAFMQSQLTVDVEDISDKHLHPAAWCSPDGRVGMVVLVAAEIQRVTLVLPATLAESALKRARMYSIGRKVEINNGPAILGPERSNRANRAGARALALSCDAQRSLALAEPPEAETHASDPWPLPADWLRSDIECGIPWILPETAGMFLPQMLGLEELGGLSYKKGCFPGQEVIARVHYRGRVTRRPARFRLATDHPPAPGSEFQVAGKPAVVLYAAPNNDQGDESVGLAVVAGEAGDRSDIRIADVTGALVNR